MSRGQQKTIFNTGLADTQGDQANAQQSRGDTEGAIKSYEDQLGDYISSDPYRKGGEYDQTINTGLASSADAGAKSTAAQVQDQSLRTGENSTAALGTIAENNRQGQRDLAAEQAQMQQGRINSESGRQGAELAAKVTPIQAQAGLYGTSLNARDSSLGTAGEASKTPGFWDTLGDSFAAALGKTAGGGNNGGGGAAAFGG